MSTAIEPELSDDEEGQETTGTAGALMALNASEIDTQIATAHKYPRSIRRFRQEALEMVTLNEDVAGECIYSLPRAGKSITGPSARFAEIIASAWGNCRAGARVIGEDERFVTTQGVFLDLQRNVGITYETKRRITDSRGNTYKDDMIGVTANAGCSIALRNAVLKGIPKAFWRDIYQAARQTAIGDVKTLSSRRTAMIEAFAKMGVHAPQLFARIEVEGEQDITLDHLEMLRGMYTALKEGDTTVDQLFGDQHAAGSKVSASKLNEKLAEDKPPKKTKAAAKLEDMPPAEWPAAKGGKMFDTAPDANDA